MNGNERAANCDRMVTLFRSVKDSLETEKLAEGSVLSPERPREGSQDVHGFFRLINDPSKTVHLQGYPGMSDESYALVYARVMDTEQLRQIGESGTVSVGNEHEAKLFDLPEYPGQLEYSYNPEQLLAALRNGIALIP